MKKLVLVTVSPHMIMPKMKVESFMSFNEIDSVEEAALAKRLGSKDKYDVDGQKARYGLFEMTLVGKDSFELKNIPIPEVKFEPPN